MAQFCLGLDDEKISAPDFLANAKNSTIVIGSRKSDLALWQTRHVKAKLEERFPDRKFEIVTSSTLGDNVTDRTLVEVGTSNNGHGVFTKDLEDNLLKGTCRLVVHSLKDMPTNLPESLCLAAITERDSPEDAVVLHPKHREKSKGLKDLPDGAVVGTSSLRRQAFIKRLYPNLQYKSIRGSVQTRLKKLEDEMEDGANAYDAVILASVGLKRCNLQDKISELLEESTFPHAVGQGALGVECKGCDTEMIEMLKAAVEHKETALRCSGERATLRTLEGGCQIAMGITSSFSEVDGKGELRLSCTLLSEDGECEVKDSYSGPCSSVDEAEKIGNELAEKLRVAGASKILGDDKKKRRITYGSAETPGLAAASNSSEASSGEQSKSSVAEKPNINWT